MTLHPKLNHWWHVTLYPSVSGLTTELIPYPSGGFTIDFDMIDHELRVRRGGGIQSFVVQGLTVAQFYARLLEALSALDVHVKINAKPYENKSTIPFPEDDTHKTYDAVAATDFWRVLCWVASVFETYRTRFCGKQTPVQLYWHSFDLVVTRFSGLPAPLENARTQSDREAYSHEVISVGFWPGDDSYPNPAFYGYAYPEPERLNTVPLQPAAAQWVEKNGGALAVLNYDDVRSADDPTAALLDFLNSLYTSSEKLAGWSSDTLEHKYATT